MNGSQFKTAGTDSMAVLASFHLHGFDLKIQAARLVLSYLKKKILPETKLPTFLLACGPPRTRRKSTDISASISLVHVHTYFSHFQSSYFRKSFLNFLSCVFWHYDQMRMMASRLDGSELARYFTSLSPVSLPVPIFCIVVSTLIKFLQNPLRMR